MTIRIAIRINETVREAGIRQRKLKANRRKGTKLRQASWYARPWRRPLADPKLVGPTVNEGGK